MRPDILRRYGSLGDSPPPPNYERLAKDMVRESLSGLRDANRFAEQAGDEKLRDLIGAARLLLKQALEHKSDCI